MQIIKNRADIYEDNEVDLEIRKDVEYLRKSINESLVDSKFTFVRKCVERMAKTYTMEGQLIHFNDFPITSHSLKLQLNNPKKLTKEKIIKTLSTWCKKKLSVCSEQCTKLQHTIDTAETKIDYFHEEAGKKKLDPNSVTEYSSCFEILISSKNELTSMAQELIAYTIIPQGRIINNNIYYEVSMDYNTIDSYLEDCGIENDKGVNTTMITKLIEDILIENHITENNDDMEWFSFKPALKINGKFALLDISYKPCNNPQKYFERNFLQPEDKVINWYNDLHRSSATRVVSTVSVDLNSKAIPPKRLTRGIYARNQEALYLRMEKDVKRLKEEVGKMTYFFDQAEPNAAKEAASSVEAHIRDENRRIAIEKAKWITISQTPPHVKVSDMLAMICDLQFVWDSSNSVH